MKQIRFAIKRLGYFVSDVACRAFEAAADKWEFRRARKRARRRSKLY